jgi:hypothetical protein
MSLKGLNKTEIAAQEFIKGAKDRVAAMTPKSAKFERMTFSLTADISKEIDRLSLVPREFRASRSDVVKAAIAVFAALPEDQQVMQLEQVK